MSDTRQTAPTDGKRDRVGGWFAGRANRKEYWLWVAPLFVVPAIWELLSPPAPPAVAFIAGLAIFCIWIRRLHDLGFSGWIAPLISLAGRGADFALDALLPRDAAAIAGLAMWSVILAALGAWPGEAGENRYGGPKTRRGDLADTFS